MVDPKFVEGQFQALLDIGIDTQDAVDSVKWAIDNLPEGTDAEAWVPQFGSLDDRISETDLHRARTLWYASPSVPAGFKRLLDAEVV